MRLSATSTLHDGGESREMLPVALENVDRVYEGWSGRPFWDYSNHDEDRSRPPRGWERLFLWYSGNELIGRWVWKFHASNRVIYDTGSCLC